MSAEKVIKKAPSRNPQVSSLDRILWIVNTLFNQLLAVITAVILGVVIKNNSVSVTFWHIILSTVAYIPLMMISIALFASDNLWSQYILRTKKQWIHGILLLLSALLVSIGILMEISNKKTKHFTSNHAKYGLSSWVLVLVSVIVGVFAHNSQTLKKFLPPVYIKFLHNIMGLAAFGTGIASLYYGLDYGSFKSHVSDDNVKATKGLMIVCAIWSCKGAYKSGYDQLKVMFSR